MSLGSLSDRPPAELPNGGDPRESVRPTNIRWLIFTLCCGASWLLYLHRYTWNTIGPVLESEYHYSATQVQMLGSMFAWTYGPCQIPSGILSDLLGPHLFLGVLIVLWSVILPGHLLVANTPALVSVRLLFGVAQAGAYPSLSKSSQVWFRPASRTILQGWIATAFGRGGGAMSSLIMGTLLMGKLGMSWQSALLVLSGAGLIFGVAFLILFRSSPEHDRRVSPAERALIDEGRSPPAAEGSKVLPWKHALRNRSLLFCMLQQFHGAGADTFYSLTLGSYFAIGWQTSKVDAGWLVALPIIGGATGGMVGAYLNDVLAGAVRNRRWTRSLIGCCGSGIAAGLMICTIAQPNARSAAWMLFAVKFFIDWNQPTIWGTITDVGGRYSATVFSIVNTSGTFGAIVIPLVLGVIRDRTKSAGGAPFAWVLATLAALYVGSALSWLFIDCTKSVEQEPATA